MKKGLTLIEVILSIAIIGLISITLLTIFNSGLKNIVSAGIRTEEVYNFESKIDSILNGNIVLNTDPIVVDNIDIIGEDATIVLNFGDGMFNKTINGTLVSLDVLEDNMNLTLKTFISK